MKIDNEFTVGVRRLVPLVVVLVIGVALIVYFIVR
ncbi:MAG: hypothetical protein QOI29_227 [Mycobacterium sp.]|jgi:hypothetical protein|nr:hypothetical protein [Mycobacterium sp.]